MDMLREILQAGWTVTARQRNVYHLTARHTNHPPVFATGETLTEAVTNLHAQVLKAEFKAWGVKG